MPSNYQRDVLHTKAMEEVHRCPCRLGCRSSGWRRKIDRAGYAHCRSCATRHWLPPSPLWGQSGHGMDRPVLLPCQGTHHFSPLLLLDDAGTESFLVQGGVWLHLRGRGLQGCYCVLSPLPRTAGTPHVCTGQAVRHASVDLRLGARHRGDEAPSKGLRPVVTASGKIAFTCLEPSALSDPSAICTDAMDSHLLVQICVPSPSNPMICRVLVHLQEYKLLFPWTISHLVRFEYVCLQSMLRAR